MKKKILSFLLVFAMISVCVGCGRSSNDTASNDEIYYTIGVAVYKQDDPEMRMYYEYLRNYIAEALPVQFIISEDLSTGEDQVAFVETMKEQGAVGIISMFGEGIAEVVASCETNEMYYVLTSATIADEDFDAVKDNEWFLGMFGPGDSDEEEAGTNMAASFAAEGAKTYLILSGGAGTADNHMHYLRTVGMLNELKEQFGLSYSQDVESLALTTELTVADTGNPDITVVISPGYLETEEAYNNLMQAFDDYDFDAVMSVVSVADIQDELEAEIKDSGISTLVGVVDCFSEENYYLATEKDATGEPLLNYVVGRSSAVITPAFIALCNAADGHMEMVKPDGTALRLHQNFWTAENADEIVELYGYTQSIYENAYSSTDIMNNMKLFNEDADYAQFEAFATADDLDSVRARMER